MVLLSDMVVLLMAGVGILLNLFVLLHLFKFARTESNRFEHGCGLPLLMTAIVDTLVLVGYIVFGIFGSDIYTALGDNADLQTFICKFMIYWTHVTTNVSIWCWMLMSAMRYMAIYHPLFQLRFWHFPRRGVQLIVLLSLLFDISLIGVVEFRENRCQLTALFGWRTASWWVHLAEIGWGFVIPVLFILIMDGRVLLLDPPFAFIRRHVSVAAQQQPFCSVDSTHSAEESLSNTSSTRSLHLSQMVTKWLAITSVNLLLNAPDNLLRLVVMFTNGELDWQWYYPVRTLCQVCYYGQFGINTIFLSLFVYNRSIKLQRSTAMVHSTARQLLVISSPPNTMTTNPSDLSPPSSGFSEKTPHLQVVIEDVLHQHESIEDDGLNF